MRICAHTQEVVDYVAEMAVVMALVYGDRDFQGTLESIDSDCPACAMAKILQTMLESPQFAYAAMQEGFSRFTDRIS